MHHWGPWKTVLLGFIFVTLGVIFPLLMVLQVLESTLFLNFLSFLLSVAGVIIGFIGMAFIVKLHRNKD